jgi:hypothetical protein
MTPRTRSSGLREGVDVPDVANPDGAGHDPMGDLLVDSLRRRMHALFSLYADAVATMDLEQVNHFEREGVLPIAFSLFHIVNMIDASFLLMTGTAPVWDASWEARVHPAIADHGKHRTVEEMVHQRIGDYDQFQEYMRTVFERVEPGPSPRRSPAPTAPGWRVTKGSPCSMPPSAGSTSTASVTWARSNWPVAWSDWAA